MVRKLHKVSDKPASMLGFRTPGVVPKEPPLGGWRAVAQQTSGKWQDRGPRGTETVQTLV